MVKDQFNITLLDAYIHLRFRHETWILYLRIHYFLAHPPLRRYWTPKSYYLFIGIDRSIQYYYSNIHTPSLCFLRHETRILFLWSRLCWRLFHHPFPPPSRYWVLPSPPLRRYWTPKSYYLFIVMMKR
jgi:hypothetical protein